jgi:hypothetical protein
MNRQERRAAAANRRKWKDGTRGIGTVVATETFRNRITGQFYWFETPEGWTQADGLPDVEIFGPFSSEAEANESQRLVLLGPQCEVTEGGKWDPVRACPADWPTGGPRALQ